MSYGLSMHSSAFVAVRPPGSAGVFLFIFLALAYILALWAAAIYLKKRGVSRRGMVIPGVIGLVALAAVPLIPLRAHALLVLLILAGLIGLAFLVVLQALLRTIAVSSFRGRLRREAASAGILRSLDGPIPLEMERPAADLERFGFERITAGAMESAGTIGTVVVLMAQDGDTIAEVARYPGPLGQRRPDVLELTSILEGGRVIMCTSTSGLGPDLRRTDLRQVFPGATVENLVSYHDDAIRFLAERGLRMQRVVKDSVLADRAMSLTAGYIEAARAPWKLTIQELTRTARGQHANIGPIADNPRARELIEYLQRGAAS